MDCDEFLFQALGPSFDHPPNSHLETMNMMFPYLKFWGPPLTIPLHFLPSFILFSLTGVENILE